MLMAAAIHLWIVPLHWDHAIAHGVLFLTLGTLQVFWSFVFVRKPSVEFSKWGIYLAGGSITLWVITRILPAPYGHGAKPITLTGVVTKIIEALAIIFLLIWLRRKISPKKRIKAIIISVVVGIFVYSGGKISEPLFPGLGSPELHQGHEMDNHKDNNHHSDSSH
jgi:hypothetical protein